jgi:hypothetical protein
MLERYYGRTDYGDSNRHPFSHRTDEEQCRRGGKEIGGGVVGGDRNGEANSLFNMAYALAKLDRRWEARQSYEQAQRIYEELQLDYWVEQCKTALYNLGQIIPAQVIRAPQIGDESDSPRRSRQRWKMPWWVWGLVSVAIVLAIALPSTAWLL